MFRRLLHIIACIFRIFLLYTSGLIKRDPKLIVFGAWWGKKYDDNPKALFEYVINKRKDIKAIWLTSNPSVYTKLKSQNMPVAMSSSIKALWYALKAKYSVVCTSDRDIGDSIFYLTGYQVTINLWHGVPLKKIVYDDEYNYSREPKKGFDGWFEKKVSYFKRKTYYYSTSEVFKKIYQSCFNVDESHVVNIGQVRNDYFFIDHDNPFREKYSEYKKIILYMPTHRKEGKESMDMTRILDLNKLNNLLKVNNTVLLIKKHYYHWHEPQIDNKVYSNVIEITNEQPNAQELLDAADILITDYSSCYIDYLLLNRPIIFYSYDLANYLATDRDMYFDYKQIAPGRICSTKDELLEEISSNLHGNDSFFEIRKRATSFYYDESNRKEVAPDTLETILKL